MTPKQAEQFNRMLRTLRRISKDYQTPDQLWRNSVKEYGLGYQEALGYAYENMQADAKLGCKGIREVVK